MNYSKQQQAERNYSGVSVDGGKSLISSSLDRPSIYQNQTKPKNSNLIDFDFVAGGGSNNNNLSNANLGANMNAPPKKEDTKIKDINDIFDSFN